MAENLIQGAITAALEVYCDRNDIHTDTLEPYANQQGHSYSKYCADLLAVLDSSKLLLLEVKELTPASSKKPAHFNAYDPYQHFLNWQFELVDVPILYGYSAVDDMSYFHRPRHRQWPNTSLHTVRVAAPSSLFGNSQQLIDREPDQEEHANLLSWLLTPSEPGSRLEQNMAALGLIGASDLKNENLMVLCAMGDQIVAVPSPELIGKIILDYPFSAVGLGDNLERYYDVLLRASMKASENLKILEDRKSSLDGESDEAMAINPRNEKRDPPNEARRSARRVMRSRSATRWIRKELDIRNGPDEACERDKEEEPDVDDRN